MPVALQTGVLSSLLESGRPNFDFWVGSSQLRLNADGSNQ